jgi:glyoxylase-like metal-dependent hydrolase (beta-lactamase superfamily II)
MKRITLGNIEAWALIDTVQAYPAEAVYPSAGSRLQDYRHHLDEEGRVTLNFACYLVRDGENLVLVDTGWGPEFQGALLAELREAGVEPGAVQTVVFTHLHGDHTGWNLDRQSGQPLFPNAQYLVPRGDWEHYSQQTPPPASFTRDVLPLEAQGKLHLIEGEHRLTPNCIAVPTPGHTPGHTSVAILSGSAGAFILGDVAISPVDVEEPDWEISFDWDAEIARETRRRLLTRLSADGSAVGASHLPGPGWGRFMNRNGRQYWQSD